MNMIYQLSSLTDCRSHITFIHIHMDCINVNTCSLVECSFKNEFHLLYETGNHFHNDSSVHILYKLHIPEPYGLKMSRLSSTLFTNSSGEPASFKSPLHRTNDVSPLHKEMRSCVLSNTLLLFFLYPLS